MAFQIRVALVSVAALGVVFATSLLVGQENDSTAPGPELNSAETTPAVSVVQEPVAPQPPVTVTQESAEAQAPSPAVQDDVDQQSSPNDVVAAQTTPSAATGSKSE